MLIIKIIYLLLLIIFALIAFAYMQIRSAGMTVKDFFKFIQANEILEKLYIFSKRYENFSVQEQIIFLKEAEKVFEAFEKVPNVLWEEEYLKYNQILNTYKNIKILRWVEQA